MQSNRNILKDSNIARAYNLWSIREAVKKFFFSGQSTKAFIPPPLGLVVKRMERLQNKFFFF